MNEERSREEILGHVDQIVEELLDEAAVGSPPVDALLIARRRGIPVREGESATRGRGGKEVVLSPRDSEERRQWLAAQAVGSERKPELLTRMGIVPEEGRALSGESLANLLAERLLLPTRWFPGDAVERAFDVLALKDRYRTAALETIAFRTLDLPQPCVVTVLDGDRVVRRRSNGPRVRKRLEAPESDCWRRVLEKGEPYTVRRDGWTVRGWAVGGRQILRAVVDLD
jgi:hypothetical protein